MRSLAIGATAIECAEAGLGIRANSIHPGIIDTPMAREILGKVDEAMRGEIALDPFVTHTMPLERINEAFDLMHEGRSIRTVIHF